MVLPSSPLLQSNFYKFSYGVRPSSTLAALSLLLLALPPSLPQQVTVTALNFMVTPGRLVARQPFRDQPILELFNSSMVREVRDSSSQVQVMINTGELYGKSLVQVEQLKRLASC